MDSVMGFLGGTLGVLMSAVFVLGWALIAGIFLAPFALLFLGPLLYSPEEPKSESAKAAATKA